MTKKPPSLFYAYFRFYIDESEIEAGLEEYCTEWEPMYSIGYNYHEYKCFVDNLGGFEHWVGDMRGYISSTRETGFLDGSPADNVFDQTLLMGTTRIIHDNIILLNGFKPSTKFILRKITAVDSGVAHKVDFGFGDSQKINHPVMYTFDSSQVEIVKQSVAGITDNSDVDSYEYMFDCSVAPGSSNDYSVHDGCTVSDYSNMFDRNMATFASIISDATGFGYMVIDTNTTFTNISGYFFNWESSGPYFSGTNIYTSPDNVTWTLAFSSGRNHGYFTFDGVGLSARYIKIYGANAAAGNQGRCDMYELIYS